MLFLFFHNNYLPYFGSFFFFLTFIWIIDRLILVTEIYRINKLLKNKGIINQKIVLPQIQ